MTSLRYRVEIFLLGFLLIALHNSLSNHFVHGQVCLPGQSNDGQQASSTASDALGPFYLPDSPITDRIAPEDQLQSPLNVLVVRGTVYGNDCIPMANALVEPWYAGIPDENGNSYSTSGSSLSYRGRIYTDECGFYNYTQTFPVVYTGRPIRHIHFRISSDLLFSEGMKQDVGTEIQHLVTQMYFENMIPSGYQPDESQIASITTDGDGTRHVEFNIQLSDVAGTANANACNITVLESTMNQDTSTGSGTADSSPQDPISRPSSPSTNQGADVPLPTPSSPSSVASLNSSGGGGGLAVGVSVPCKVGMASLFGALLVAAL